MKSSSAPAPSPLVTINILAYNRRDEVRQTLRELEKVDYPREQLEILVVDNASSDGTGEMIAEEFPDVRVVTLAPNRAVAGWNAGFEAGRGEFFLVLDDDSAPQSGLKEAIAFLQSHPSIGILALKITGGLYTTQMLEDEQEFIGFIGCGAIIRREVVEAIGGYAPWIYLYAHEWEYGVRCLDAGFDIRYFKGCTVHHRASEVNRSTRRSRVYSTRNELLIIHKYFSRQRALLMMRTLFYNAVSFRGDVARSLIYTLRGWAMFLRDARQLNASFVKPEVQQKYVALYWSTRPILPGFFGRVFKRLNPSRD